MKQILSQFMIDTKTIWGNSPEDTTTPAQRVWSCIPNSTKKGTSLNGPFTRGSSIFGGFPGWDGGQKLVDEGVFGE